MEKAACTSGEGVKDVLSANTAVVANSSGSLDLEKQQAQQFGASHAYLYSGGAAAAS